MMDKSVRIVRCAVSIACTQPVRFARSKPWIPKFKILRTLQPFKAHPNVRQILDKIRNHKNPNEMQRKMRQDGYLPPSKFLDRTMFVSHTDRQFEAYVPPKFDGISSRISKEGAVRGMHVIGDTTKSFRAERTIRKYDPEFSSSEFAKEAFDIYKRAHELLQNYREKDLELLDLVTDGAFFEMTAGLEQKTFRWTFHGSIEPPKAVHTRVGSLLNEDDTFAQVTMRFHSKQTMAIYDRFGRLCYGSPTLKKDVLEYVVFEKHLADEYGEWRIHSKILPEGGRRRNYYLRTMPVPQKLETEVEEGEQSSVVNEEDGRKDVL